MKPSKSISLQEFLDFFPIVDLPITVSEEIVEEISKVNKILPEIALAQYLSKWEGEIDIFSEFLPCCQFKPQDAYYALVYWKASLMTYEFKLVTLDKQGNHIQNKVIAGVVSNGTTIAQSVAKIEDDFSIHIVVGEKKIDEPNYDPLNSKGHYMELLPNGQFISSKDDNTLWQEKNTNKEN